MLVKNDPARTQTTRTQGADQAQWASNVKNTSRAVEMGMKVLNALVQPDGKAPGGLMAAAMTAVNEAVDLLATLMKSRFNEPMAKTNIGMLDVAQRALSRAGSSFHEMEGRVDAARVPPGAVNFPSEWFGDVDNAASKLVSAAASSGKPQVVDFNGTKLIALPGQKATEVVKDWKDAQSAVKNPLRGLEYEVKDRMGAETAKAELGALAKTPPRPLGAVLASLDGLVAKKEYGSQMMAGLCELKHPAEIKSFLEHVLEHPPMKEGGAGNVDDQRKTAVGNVRFWVNEREGAARGTKASWNTALDEVITARAQGGGKPQAVVTAKARGASRILGELQKLVDTKRYSHTFLAGLCELTEPKDMKAFLSHFHANPDKKDASTSTADARNTMLKNATFWIRDREGGAPGTKGAWMKAIDEVVKENAPKMLEWGSFGISVNIDTVAQGMAAKATKENRSFAYEFNGIEIVANPGDDAAKVKKPFSDAMANAAKAHAEAEKIAGEKRQGRLDNFLAGGGKIIDTPPPGLTFDTRGLLPPGGLYNSHTSKPLQLITENQLKTLPEGTRLMSISGKEAIKGIDAIDNDSRGGFIAFGFPQ